MSHYVLSGLLNPVSHTLTIAGKMSVVNIAKGLLTGHAQVFSLSSLMTTLWTVNWLTTSVFESFTANMIFTETYLNSHTNTGNVALTLTV